MVLHMDEEIRNGVQITHKTLNRILGFAMSFKLAVPVISIFTREIYRALVFEADESDPVRLTGTILAAIRALPNTVKKFGGNPIFVKESDATLLVDTSVSASGDYFTSIFSDDVIQSSTPLPNALIGTPSTERELHGCCTSVKKLAPILAKLAQDKANTKELVALAIRIVIDCQGAVFGLLKPGSKIHAQNEIIKEIFSVLKEWNITPYPKWSKRSLLQCVDDLSKKWAKLPKLSEGALLKILRAFPGKRVLTPEPNKIATVLDRIRVSKAAVVVHPVWIPQPWWPLIVSQRKRHIELGAFSEAFGEDEEQTPEWSFHASLIE
jgi:hypothetical protein